MAEKFYNHLYETYPRIYVTQDLNEGAEISLSSSHAHYFKNVLRRQEGDFIRLFNGRDGEWVGALAALGKKSGQVVLQEKTRDQPMLANKASLYFTPIKKARLDILIEKAVELGVDALYPVITERCENRKPKMDRLQAQVIEAAEQCERLTIPELHAPQMLKNVQGGRQAIHACIERDAQRENAPFITSVKYSQPDNDLAFLIGPEGGFSEGEIAWMAAQEQIRFISLGDRIYRAETAAFVCLTHVAFLRDA